MKPKKKKMKANLVGKQKWCIIYPPYIDNKKTISEGRKIAASAAVNAPTADVIAEALKELKIECQVEAEKAYPRDFTVKGRVRFRYRDENGAILHKDFKNSLHLFNFDFFAFQS